MCRCIGDGVRRTESLQNSDSNLSGRGPFSFSTSANPRDHQNRHCHPSWTFSLFLLSFLFNDDEKKKKQKRFQTCSKANGRVNGRAGSFSQLVIQSSDIPQCINDALSFTIDNLVGCVINEEKRKN